MKNYYYQWVGILEAIRSCQQFHIFMEKISTFLQYKTILLLFICRGLFREFKNWDINLLLQNTYNVSNIIYSFLVTNFVILNNPQITKALPRGAVGAAGSVTIIIFLTHLSARKASAHFFALACGPGKGVRKNCWLKMNFSKHIRREHLTKEGLKSPLTGINKNCFK